AAAEARGAKPLARILGVGVAALPQRALEMALAEAGVSADQVVCWMADAPFARYLQSAHPSAAVKRADGVCGDTAGAAFLLQLVLGLDECGKGPVAVAVSDSAASVVALLG
ncbi:MAG: hypothetical protein J6336_13490, partial [Kiritimatiellae bacterium]|nr:hypothetical protein [Kiritimatiellia bacterium]